MHGPVGKRLGGGQPKQIICNGSAASESIPDAHTHKFKTCPISPTFQTYLTRNDFFFFFEAVSGDWHFMEQMLAIAGMSNRSKRRFPAYRGRVWKIPRHSLGEGAT